MSRWKDLRNQNPYHSTLPNRVSGDECENTSSYDAVRLRKIGVGAKSQRDDVTCRANVQQSAAAETVDQPEPDKRKDQIGDSNPKRLKQLNCSLEPAIPKIRGAK